jgi:hypothetical protein
VAWDAKPLDERATGGDDNHQPIYATENVEDGGVIMTQDKRTNSRVS